MGSKIAGIVVLAVIFAGVADLVAHPSGAQSLFSGANSLLGSTYTAASGGYA